MGVESAHMAGFEQKLLAGTLALGLSAVAFAQAPAQGPPAAGAARKVMTAPNPAAPPPAVAPKASATQPPQQAQPQAPPQPVVPPRPEQMAPVAPLVTYENGQLSIQAQNATLGAILNAVRARTGAQVDVPAEASNDRVAANLGPGNPRDVMASLLQGSRFDYILLGSLDDPNGVSQVVLTPRQGGAASGTAVAGGNPASSPGGSPQSGPPGPFRGGAARPEINAEEEEPEPEPQPEPAPAPAAQNPPQPGAYPPGTMVQPGGPGQVNPQIPPIQPNPQIPGQPGQVRTPEQLLQELQRMQQQQQLQRQQQQQE
jgi:hypothetical protein